MSEPDDLDAQRDAWEYQQETIRATQMTAHPDCRDPEHPGCSQCMERERSCEDGCNGCEECTDFDPWKADRDAQTDPASAGDPGFF